MPKLIEHVRAVGFDLDGTLVDSVPDLAAASNEMLGALGHLPLAESKVADRVGGGIERLVELVLSESTGQAPSRRSLAEAIDLFRTRYAERVFERSSLYPGVVEGLGALAALGIPTCCVTNKHSAFTSRLLETAGLHRLLSFALCADRAEDRKPAPNLLIAACARFALPPDRVLYVGDSRIDIATARAAGCPVAAVDYGYSRASSLAALKPDWLIGSLRDIVDLTAY